MLRCRFFRNPEGLYSGFELTGHAEGAGKGNNLACAAATTLAQTCISSLHKLLSRELVIEKGQSGFLRCVLQGEPDKEADLLFRSMETGMQYVQKADAESGILIEYE